MPALLVLSVPVSADPGDDAAAQLARIAKFDDAGSQLNAVIVVNPNDAVPGTAPGTVE